MSELWNLPIAGHIVPAEKTMEALLCFGSVGMGNIVMIRGKAFRQFSPGKLEPDDILAVAVAPFSIGEAAEFREGQPTIKIQP